MTPTVHATSRSGRAQRARSQDRRLVTQSEQPDSDGLGLELNLAVLRGRLSRPAGSRVLESGDLLVTLDVTVRNSWGPADSVPVVVVPSPASLAELDAGEEVAVLGRVRRRFFRSAAGTQSRTEVAAEKVVTGRRSSQLRRCLSEALQRLDRSLEGD